jgi:hypothetical protein
VEFLENSTKVNVLFSPNVSKNNVLTQMEVVVLETEGETVFQLKKVKDHKLGSTKMSTFAVSS